MKIPSELRGVLGMDPEVMGGAICFVGTRIPVTILLDNLRAGVPMAEIRDAYPDLTPEQIQAVVDFEDGQARRAMGLALAG